MIDLRKEINSSVGTRDYWLDHAIGNILADYGDVVSAEAKNKDLLKFGRNALVQTTKSTLMTLPTGISNENYLTSNLITTISSATPSDTQSVTIEGHTTADAGLTFTFVTQTINLNGRTQVTLATPLCRVSRLVNNGSTDFVGRIYVYENDTTSGGVPDTDILVHLIVEAGINNSEKASTTISNTDYYVITEFYCDCLEKTAAFGIVHFEVRLAGGVFRNVVDISANDTNSGNHEFHPYLVIPKNADVRLRVSASANNKDFSGGFEGVLLKVI